MEFDEFFYLFIAFSWKVKKRWRKCINGTRDEENTFKKATSQENFIKAKIFHDEICLLCQFLRNDELHIN